jgi:hypothetical protein
MYGTPQHAACCARAASARRAILSSLPGARARATLRGPPYLKGSRPCHAQAAEARGTALTAVTAVTTVAVVTTVAAALGLCRPGSTGGGVDAVAQTPGPCGSVVLCLRGPMRSRGLDPDVGEPRRRVYIYI